MKFGDIYNLPYDPGSGKARLDAIVAALPDVPSEVAAQFLADHGRNPDFQAQYAALELAGISWKKTRFPASELITASMYAKFERWFGTVSGRLSAFPEKGWRSIDSRTAVVEQWERNHTWALAPVFLAGELVGRPSRLHLAEGHTRLGTLAGAVNAGLISLESSHEVWLGTGKP